MHHSYMTDRLGANICPCLSQFDQCTPPTHTHIYIHPNPTEVFELELLSYLGVNNYLTQSGNALLNRVESGHDDRFIPYNERHYVQIMSLHKESYRGGDPSLDLLHMQMME